MSHYNYTVEWTDYNKSHDAAQYHDSVSSSAAVTKTTGALKYEKPPFHACELSSLLNPKQLHLKSVSLQRDGFVNTCICSGESVHARSLFSSLC